MSSPDEQLSPVLAERADGSGRAFLVLCQDFVEIFLGGEIDLAIRDVLDRIVECASKMDCPVIVDASGVTFADSTLVHMLAAFPDQSTLSLRHPEAKITDLLALAGLQVRTSGEDRVRHSSGQMRTSLRHQPVLG